MLTSHHTPRVRRDLRHTVRTIHRHRVTASLLHEHAEFRVTALPTFTATTGDLIVCDRHGRSFLLSPESTTPLPLDQSDVNALGMFFEPAVDLAWHSERELRGMLRHDAKPVASA